MKKPLKIIHISSEVDPFAKTGGLADVACSLPKALKRLGQKVVVITPLHRCTDPKKFQLQKILSGVPLRPDEGGQAVKLNVWQGYLLEELPIYFIDYWPLFQKKTNLYGPGSNKKYWLFDYAACKLITLLNLKPDIIHCHDWQSGLAPYFIAKRFSQNPNFKRTSTVYTIHNLLFQMEGPWGNIPLGKKDNGRSDLPSYQSLNVPYINFAKRAIIYSDFINAVSEQYAQEIITREFGEDLNQALKKRYQAGELTGIVNGIDYFDYNPQTDPGLVANYSVKTLDKMVLNKTHLQRKFCLPVNPKIPLVAMVSRITEQKGFDLMMEIMETLVKLDLQLIIFGAGDKRYERFFRQIAKRYPKKVATRLEFNARDATKIYAGSDMFLMPSRFEPCGLGQLISLRYGSIPIVHAVGGLANTVTDFNPKTRHGNGFVFKNYNSQELLVTITRALETYKYEKIWHELIKTTMNQSYSWEIPAQKYLAMYKKVIRLKREKERK